MDKNQFQQLCTDLTKKLIDDGKLIEAGFVGLRMQAISPDAPDIQVREMRLAYLAGAQHLFFSIVSVLDSAHEPTERDMERMAKIDAELHAITKELQNWHHH